MCLLLKLTVAGVSIVCYILAAFIQNKWIMLPIALLLLIGTLLTIKMIYKKKEINSNY